MFWRHADIGSDGAIGQLYDCAVGNRTDNADDHADDHARSASAHVHRPTRV
jgi:hypothetical protein